MDQSNVPDPVEELSEPEEFEPDEIAPRLLSVRDMMLVSELSELRKHTLELWDKCPPYLADKAMLIQIKLKNAIDKFMEG